MDLALISLDLALSPSSTCVSSDYMVLCKCLKNCTYFSLPCRGGIGPLPGAQTKYCSSVRDAVGWVIWHVKIVPDMTYNVFGGMLNHTLLLLFNCLQLYTASSPCLSTMRCLNSHTPNNALSELFSNNLHISSNVSDWAVFDGNPCLLISWL